MPEYTIPPMDFEPPAPVLLIEPTIENVINFFVDYMKSEHLGVIANAHVRIYQTLSSFPSIDINLITLIAGFC